MASRFFAIGFLGIMTALATASSVSTARHTHLRTAASPGPAALRGFGSRSTEQVHSEAGAKFDGALADLSRHAALVRPAHALEDLRSLSPAAKFAQFSATAAPLVLIDAVTRGDPQQLKASLVELGLQRPAVYSNDVSGWLPVAALDAAAARGEVRALRASMPRTRSGAVTSQGDYAQRSDVARSTNALTGAGITVGAISDSYDCYSVFAANGVPASGDAGYASNGFLASAADDISTGDLPSAVNVLSEAPCMDGTHYNGYPNQLPFGDEGRAMLQIVHDVAPGAALSFYTAENGEADFASGIAALAAAGAKVIADDVGYYDEPFFQDGIVAKAIDAAVAQGVAYFSAAGNGGTLAYDNTAPSFSTVSSGAQNTGELLLNFDPSGATTTTSLPVTIPALIPGDFVAIVVEWDQPYISGAPDSGGATSAIDVCVLKASGEVLTCSGANATGTDPYQALIVGNPANSGGNSAAETVTIQVGLAGGTPAPGRIKLAVEDDGAGSTINAFATNGATLQGHPGAAGAAAVGAASYLKTPDCGVSPAELEYYSSRAGDPILFDASGNRLATPIIRQKPDFVGPDRGNNTFFGFELTASEATTSVADCKNNLNLPSFAGTSAATPHAAAIAALMLQANPALTPAQIYQALRDSALPMGAVPNVDSGYGFVQAEAAFALTPQVVPAAPALTLAAASIAAGGSTTLTWSAVNATGCTASGSWSGALSSGGTQTVSPTAAGTEAFTLICANAAGPSASSTANLTVTAAPSSGHGGGALDRLSLLALAGLVFVGFFRPRRRMLP